ncbi:hypothetical protein [Methylophaga sp.]|jgi:hypothetical protein|uniref:hypothetical protein n=1 Tax=Methylophaga sp. TaxID=2024840 RepID=UPI000C665571|nr:hypothetical protein [Methylophaga sp.]MBP24315.1 hypothetical protein [Methylophaga sp.]|tara:strand:- start:67 stop:252 length:186 start_codon:yes stop_codon:yes gene_type:complete
MEKLGYTNHTDRVAFKVDDIIRLLIERPTNAWLKGDIQDWLKVRNIDYEDNDTKTELLERM